MLTKGITLFNKKWGRNPFASHKKVRAARDNILPINRFILIIGKRMMTWLDKRGGGVMTTVNSNNLMTSLLHPWPERMI